MNSTNKILFLSRTSLLGGAEISLRDLLKKIDKSFFYPVVVLPDSKGLFYKGLKKIKVETIIKKMAFVRNSYNVFLLIWFLCNIIYMNFCFLWLIKRHDIDLVVCNSFQDSVFVALPAKILRKKLVIYVKNILDKRWKKYIRAKICDIFADKVIAISKENSKDYLGFSKKKEKISVIYEGLDISRFIKNISKKDVYSEYINLGEKCYRIINIGNISELKGQKLLLRALSLDLFKYVNFKLFFIGEANFKKDLEYKREMQNYIKEHKLSDNVFFLGFKKNIKDYIRYSDLLVHCPVMEEGLGLVILEAFCLEKVVIGTSIGGIPEIIEYGVNGFLSGVDEKELAEKILYVYKNRDGLEQIRRNALKTVKERFSLDIKIKKTVEIFKKLLTG